MADNKLIDKLDNDNIPVFSVSEIANEITNLLEAKYSYVKIQGEISGETGNKYPEIYFTLKDEENVTGHYVTSDTSGMYTNYFLTEPKIIGASFKLNF